MWEILVGGTDKDGRYLGGIVHDFLTKWSCSKLKVVELSITLRAYKLHSKNEVEEKPDACSNSERYNGLAKNFIWRGFACAHD
jgi:hypothetical protein